MENSTLSPAAMESNLTALNDTMQDSPPCTEATPPEPPSFDMEQYYYKLSGDLFIFFDPIIVSVGIVGAALMIAVMQRPALRCSSVSVYMTALAVSDAAVLILDFLNNWLKMEVGVYLLGTSDGFCKFHRFFFNVVYTYSGWLVVGLAVEKVLVVWFPFKAKTLCNKRNATVAVCSMPVVIIGIYLYNLWAWQLNPEGECDMVPAWVHFQSNVGPWISGTIYSYVPILLLIGLNSALCYKLWEARERRRNNLGIDKNRPLDDKVERKVTVTVVVICVAYVLLTLPLALFYVILFLAGEFINPGPSLALGESLILIFGLSNHAINFFLYVLTSARFRAELMAMFGRAVDSSDSPRKPTVGHVQQKREAGQKAIAVSEEITGEKSSRSVEASTCSSPKTSHCTDSTAVASSSAVEISIEQPEV